MRQNGSANVVWFLAGFSMGAAIGMIFAPASGAQTRRHAKEYVTIHGHDAYERGRELYEKGRHLADEAAELFEEGRRLVEEAEATNA